MKFIKKKIKADESMIKLFIKIVIFIPVCLKEEKIMPKRMFRLFFLMFCLWTFLQADCSNTHIGLKLQTFDRSDNTLYINNAAEFVSAFSTAQTKEIGRGIIAQLDGGINPFSTQQDDFLSRVTGNITVAESGKYTFAIDGDDALELWIDGTLVVSWYGGHSVCNCTTHTGTIVLSAGKHHVELRHHERSGASVYRVYWKKPANSVFELISSGVFDYCTPQSPLAEYTFSECVLDGTSSDVKDRTSNGYHGTSSNVITTNGEKVLTRSLDLTKNATTDFVTLPAALMHDKESFSVALWLKSSSLQDQSILSMANSAIDNEALLFFSHNGTTFSPHIKGVRTDIAIPNIFDNQWHHIVWDRNGTSGELCLIIDGNISSKYCGNNAKTGKLIVEGLVVGQEQDSVNGSFNIGQDFEGYIDELKFYSSLLSNDDIVEIYTNEKNGRTYDGLETVDIFCSPNSCSNYAPQLNIATYNLTTASESAIASHEQFVSVITHYGTQAYRFGSGLVPWINTQGANNNTFGADDRYMSVIDGYINIPVSGTYTFLVNGDDGVEVLIDGMVASSWYGNHAASTTPATTTAITQKSIELGRGYHKLEFHHFENTGSDNYELYWKKPGDGNFSIIPTSYFYHCIPYPPKVEYRFDECNEYNGTVNEVKDSSGNAWHAFASQTPHIETGQIYKAIDLRVDGTTDFITLPANAMHALQDFTLSIWIKAPPKTEQTILSGANSSQFNEMLLFITSNGNSIAPYIKGVSTPIAVPNVTDNTWHHVVWRRNGLTGKNCITVDGNTTSCVNGTAGALNIQGLILGQEQDSVGGGFVKEQDFEGVMDEFKIYDKFLTDEEITKLHYNESKTLNFDGSFREKPFCLILEQCYSDNFNRTELGKKWSIISNVNYTPKIVSNKLFLTELIGYASTGTTLIGSFPSLNNYIEIEFKHNAYGGSGADGMTIALADAAVVDPLIEANATNIAGGFGGSLGYAQYNTTPGFKGGWLGFGFDEYGNFSNGNSDGREGGNGTVSDSVSIRGKGSGTSGYAFITGTATLSPGIDNSTLADGYTYKLSIDTRNSKTMVKVERDLLDGNGYRVLIDWYDATQNASSPEKFKFSLTGSTGGSTNYHTIDDLSIKAVGCGTLGKEEEIKNHMFDAWELVGGSLTSRAIKTKIVSQNFNLNVVSLNESNVNYEDFNGTVCAKIVDDANRTLSPWSKALFTNQSSVPMTFYSEHASKNSRMFIKWKKSQDISCDAMVEDNQTVSTDNFAIRPNRFVLIPPSEPLYAGESFFMNATAFNALNTPTLNYNESKDNSFNITGSIVNPMCVNASLSMDAFSFSHGTKSDINTTYHDVGDLNLTLKEISGNEFAKIDNKAYDTEDDATRLIAPHSEVIQIAPYELNITSVSFDASSGKSWLYDANVSEMYVTAKATVQANNKIHQALQNFTSECYAKPVDVTFYYDVNNTNKDVNLSYTTVQANMQSSSKLITDINKTMTLPLTSFSTARASAEYRFNIDRSYQTPLNPMIIRLKDTNVTSTAVAKNENNATLNSTKTFYYGRLKTNDITTDKTVTPHFLHVEIYSTSPLSGFYQTSLNWWIHKNDGLILASDVNMSAYQSFTQTTPSSLGISGKSGFNEGILSFNITNPTRIKGGTFHLDIPLWLWYSSLINKEYQAGGDCSTHPCFEYKFLENATTIGIKSGEMKGTSIGKDYNSSYQKSGVKIFR